jgi:hypothetical protein
MAMADGTTDREKRVAELTKDISSVVRELAEHCLAADLAVARGDFDVLCTSSERALVLQRRWSLLYRQTLACRITSSRISESCSL